MAQKSQPMVLRGCREATMDPIVRASATPLTRSATESTTSDQASQAAERVLIPPTRRPCSLAPSVTTLLYSTTVSQTLRQPLRASFSERGSAELTKIPLPIGQAMYACIDETGGG